MLQHAAHGSIRMHSRAGPTLNYYANLTLRRSHPKPFGRKYNVVYVPMGESIRLWPGMTTD
jgi:hypothetical protein